MQETPSRQRREERQSFGNLRRVVERRRPGAGGPPLRITEFDYDARFNLISGQRGPYYANELQNRIDHGPSWTMRLSYDARGNLVGIRHPDCVGNDGTVQTGLLMKLDVDARGRLVRRAIVLEDGSTLATTYDYPPDTDPSTAIPSRETTDADDIASVRTIVSDPAGRTTHIEESSGLVMDRRFDHAGRVMRIEESIGIGSPSVMTVDWAPHDRPLLCTRNRVDASGIEESEAQMMEEFWFDLDGNVRESTVRSKDGAVDRVVTLERGPNHLIRSSLEDGVETKFTYNARGLLLTREVVAPGVPPMSWRMEYDRVGRLVAAIDSANLVERIEYDGFGRVRSMRGPSGARVEQEWDASDRPLLRELWGRHPDVSEPVRLSSERFVYDECGRVVREEQAIYDPGVASSSAVWAQRAYTYDRADRVVRIDGPGSTTQTFSYDGLGRVVRAVGARAAARTVFDDDARTVRHEVTLRGDDSSGVDVAATFVSIQKLDARGRSVAETDGLGNTFRREYDTHDHQTATVDASGVRHEVVYSPDGRVITTTRAAGTPSSFTWTHHFDSYLRPESVTGPRGEVMHITRDGLGRPRRIEAASRGVDFSYDDAGRLEQTIESSGVVTQLMYGADGRVERRIVDAAGAAASSTRFGQGTSDIRFEYDGHGNLTLADDGVTPVRRRYDSRGLLLREQTGVSSVAWRYDEAGRPSGFTFPSGRRLRFERARRTVASNGSSTSGQPRRPAPEPRYCAHGRGGWGRCANNAGVRQRSAQKAGTAPAGWSRREERRTADDATLFGLRQVSDERGLPGARQITVRPYEESAVYRVDEQAWIVSQSFGADPLDVAGLDATIGALTQSSHDAELSLCAGSTLPSPATDEVVVVLAPDSSRVTEQVTTPVGAGPSTTTYASSIAGRVTAQGVARSDDDDSLPSFIDGTSFRYDAFHQLASVGAAGAQGVVITRMPWAVLVA